jgi:hypothetical protein
MILRPDQLRLQRLTGRANPYNFGGDSDSDSSTQTTSNTTNHVSNQDMRNVASDSAVALSGSNNSIDRSSSSVTSFLDMSDRSQVTSFIDNSTKDSSTKFTDNSDRSTHTTVTDYGSVGGSLTLAGSMTTKAFDVAGLGINGAIETLKQQSSDSLKAIGMAFDSAKGQSATSAASSAAVLGFAGKALEATQSAMQDAKDGGQSKMVLAALGVIGAVGIAFAMR